MTYDASRATIVFDDDSAQAQRFSLPENFLDTVVQMTLRQSYFAHIQSQVTIEIALATREVIQSLNHQTMGKNVPTDVLSYPAHATEREIRLAADSGSVFLGEMVLCLEAIEQDARTDEIPFLRELAFVASHGVLHLLGYEHGEEMFALQDDVCDNIR